MVTRPCYLTPRQGFLAWCVAHSWAAAGKNGYGRFQVRVPGGARERLATGQMPGSHAGRAIDGLAEQVGVPIVARVLLHEVLPHPPHGGGHLPEREFVV